MNFEIPLSAQKVKPHQVTTLHLIMGFALLAASAFIVIMFMNMSIMPFSWETVENPAEVNMHLILLPEYILMGIGIIILYLAMFRNKWLLRKNNNRTVRIVELILCIAIAANATMNNAMVLTGIFGIIGATIVYSLFTETSDKAPMVSVSDSGIDLPMSLRQRHIHWAEVEKLLLRHGTLTINCVDNRMYQWMVAQNDVDATAFETFCNSQIEAAKGDRKKYNW
ncbi:MAG: hypothetical protein H6551_11605 [Chitinophagales bacterium]|nr:hypothetical protein [Chitinophagaceae bacterium]MCB9065773.1 hypothetical protein [Chitinophagales bacterium]